MTPPFGAKDVITLLLIEPCFNGVNMGEEQLDVVLGCCTDEVLASDGVEDAVGLDRRRNGFHGRKGSDA